MLFDPVEDVIRKDQLVKMDDQNNSLGERLRAWIAANYPSNKEFSRISGIAYPTINNWLSGKREPNWSALNKLIELGYRPMENIFVGARDNSQFEMVRLLDVEASAGKGVPVYSEGIMDCYAFNKSYIKSKGLTGADMGLIFVRGGSMENALFNGDLVLIHHGAPPKHGKISVVRSGNDLYIKRMTSTKRGWIALSDAPGYDPIEIDDEADVIGLAICSMRDL